MGTELQTENNVGGLTGIPQHCPSPLMIIDQDLVFREQPVEELGPGSGPILKRDKEDRYNDPDCRVQLPDSGTRKLKLLL